MIDLPISVAMLGNLRFALRLLGKSRAGFSAVAIIDLADRPVASGLTPDQ